MSELSLSGSCLCGAVVYAISGEALHFYHCHCQRCRKATGTGHASNIIMRPNSVAWTAGEHLLTTFKVPQARRFATSFCSICGSLMPRIAPDKSVAVVPAGTLDNLPAIRPEARIFQDSRADWSCEDSELPAHATYPSTDG